MTRSLNKAETPVDLRGIYCNVLGILYWVVTGHAVSAVRRSSIVAKVN